MFSVSIEREDIAVDVMHSITVPDEKWTFVDKKGHGHFWKGKKIPTCKYVKVGEEWVGDEYDGEVYDIKEWQCKTCGETIEPGYRQETPPTHVPGPTWVTIEIAGAQYVVTPEQYADSIAAWGKSLIEICTFRREPPIEFDKTGERKR